MIFVECYPDKALIRGLLAPPQRDVVHDLHGKYEVAKRISSSSASKALLDEDPGTVVPPYLKRMTLAEDLTDHGLKQYKDRARDNTVVVLTPRLEEWLVGAAREAGIRIAEYRLPDRAHELKNVINDNLDKLDRLIGDLRDSRSVRIRELRRLLG